MLSSWISRRNFLIKAGMFAAGASVASRGGDATTTAAPIPSVETDSTTFDLVVVGAGIAGIAAARTAQSYGASVLVLEAQSYIGGRAFTDNTTFPEILFDRGAQFFQQVIAGNDLL